MSEERGLPKPNYTGIPNALFAIMPKMGEAELRVVLAICRQTFGWHKKNDKISLRQLQELTGLGRPAVVRGITQGEERGLIKRRAVKKDDPEKGYFYSLVVSEENHLEDTEGYSKETTSGSPKIPLATREVVSERYQQKKGKETIQKKTNDNPPNDAAADAAAIEKPKSKRTPKAPQDMTAHEAIIDAYVQELGYNPPNGSAMGTAAAWLVKNGYTPEQVRDCYRHFKAKPFYADKPLSLQTIRTNIPDYLRFLESQPAPSPTAAECLTALENINKVIERDSMGNPIAQLPKYAAALAERGETFNSVRGAWMKCKKARSPVGAFMTWVRDNQMVVGVQGEEKVMYDDSGNKLILVQGIGWQQVSA